MNSVPADQTAPTESRLASLIKVSGLHYRYASGPPVLIDIDLEVSAGEIVALLGPNGAGKSTLLRVVLNELTPESGVITGPLLSMKSGRVVMGYAGEENAHFNSLTGIQNAHFFARAAGVEKHEVSERVSGLMNLVGLLDEADKVVSSYSFGAKRKLLLLEALVHQPKLLLLDEPTVGLDPISRDALADILKKCSQEGSAIVMASHDLNFLEQLADRILVIDEGRVVSSGSQSELLSSLGTATRFQVSVDATSVELPQYFGEDVELVDDTGPLVFETTRGQAALPDIWAALISSRVKILEVEVREPGLAELFRRVTGQELPG